MSSLDELYRRVIMDHYQSPRNRGEIEDADATIQLKNPTCGDQIRLQMKIDDGKIIDCKFDGEGCSISMASASMMTEAIKGLDVNDALDLADRFSKMMLGKDVDTEDFEDIEALQGVCKFPARIKCATLSWKAMEKGINECGCDHDHK
ncbi:SUF system NifU family Fe-S cluster assembly protein [Vulcanibacillus modesticaldus]|uniref:SUF system NifU family Fe-S cluster assembly protein n=1 Tax=Vulcanibacillus modesticaldus TaxID=337097 RepID=A0A1D2YUQ4_9BACI|nr:SUF system NifU family Fe-S cluster assembly protein [Vulcanibacillus modesticaldus]OEF99401.1 SUF system NifU family Fe-S cluster assembly protein [Vulcanibacillus modesticaldus]